VGTDLRGNAILWPCAAAAPLTIAARRRSALKERAASYLGKEVTHTLKANNKKKDVIAMRQGCKPSGTGLSHYVLMDEKKK
jgi:modified peptide precursor CbpA